MRDPDPLSLSAFCIITTFSFSCRNGCVVIFHHHLICISLTASDVEHLFLCSLVKNLFTSECVCQSTTTQLQTLSTFNNRYLFSQFWRPEVQDQGVCRFVFPSGLSPWCAESRLLPVPSHGRQTSLCVQIASSVWSRNSSLVGVGPNRSASF